MSTVLDEKLLDILVCPQDRGPLLLIDGEWLYNPRLRRAYPIEDGIPVPDPRAGSACKRLHLYLRWMVRPDDGVDLGVDGDDRRARIGHDASRGTAHPIGRPGVGLLHETELDELGDERPDGRSVEAGERGQVGARGRAAPVHELEHRRKVSTANRVDGVSEGCHVAHNSGCRDVARPDTAGAVAPGWGRNRYFVVIDPNCGICV